MTMARVLRTSVVAPSPSGPERTLPLTYLDALWLHASPVERVFYYYPDAASTPTSDAISALEDSLSRALAVYYPLAGRLRLTSGTTNRYELYYRPGDAVTFAVADYDHVGGMDELVKDGDEPTEVAKVVPLVPTLPEGGAVMALQATVLRGGGLALGVTVHHGACDGVASTRFLHTWAWAAAARTGDAQAPELPVIERGFIRERDDLYDIFVTPRPPSDDDDVDQLLLATFVLSKEHLQCVKDTVAREAERRGVVPTPRSTSIVAAFGLIWQCYVRAKRPARDSDGGAAPDEGLSYFLFPADHRARLDVPAGYFGNCVGPCLASVPRKEVGAGGADGLFAACAAVGAAVDHMVRGGPEYWEGWMERVMAAYGAGEPPLSVAGSPRFRVYDVDFGFGRPAKVDVMSVARTGAISVAEERGGRGGGVEVGICLPKCGMARFHECFGDAMASLSLPVPGQGHADETD